MVILVLRDEEVCKPPLNGHERGCSSLSAGMKSAATQLPLRLMQIALKTSCTLHSPTRESQKQEAAFSERCLGTGAQPKLS